MAISIRATLVHPYYRCFLDALVVGELADQTHAHHVTMHLGRCPMYRNAAHTTEVVKHRLALQRLLPTHQRARVRREER